MTKGANVTIEHIAFGDIKFELLADQLGLADADHARGKIGRLWLECTETQAYTVSLDVVCKVLGPVGVDALLVAELGELVPAHLRTPFARGALREPVSSRGVDPVMRMRGTEHRIEWFGRNRVSSAAGGRALQAKLRAERGVDKAVRKPVASSSTAPQLAPTSGLVESQVACLRLSTPLSREQVEVFPTSHQTLPPAEPRAVPAAEPGASPLIPDPRSKISDQNQSCEEAGTREAEAALALTALRSRLAIRTESAAPRVSPTDRLELAEIFATCRPTEEQFALALALLEQRAEAELDVGVLSIDNLRRMLAAAGARPRAGAKRAELRVVRDEQSEEADRG